MKFISWFFLSAALVLGTQSVTGQDFATVELEEPLDAVDIARGAKPR